MTGAAPIRTVGDLIDRLSQFDPDAPVRAQGALALVPDFIVGVGPSPDIPDTVAIVYMAPAAEDVG